MPNVDAHQPGSFCWVELGTSDQPGAKRFYNELFAWTANDVPIGPDDFYTMFQLQPVGKKAHVQVCGTTPCRLRGASDIIEVCQSRIHHEPFHLSKDGNFSWEEVECLGACVNAPMVLIWKDTYEDLTKETFGKVLDGFASGKPPKPGPQIDRQFSAPVGGPTTLKETT